jgi:hypothetical protein
LQLTEAGVIEDVFSLCFGGVSGGGALLLGDVPLPSGALCMRPPRSACCGF